MYNYQIYILYNIFDNELKNTYIGKTRNWGVRKYQHKRRCNDEHDKGYNLKVYKYIRKTGGFENWKMKKLVDISVEDKKDKLVNNMELFYIELYNSKLNTAKPIEW